MRFSVERDVLAEATGWAARYLPKSTAGTQQVLTGLLIEATLPAGAATSERPTGEQPAGEQPAGAREIASLTPMMRQYLELKALHPDTVLFFRLGDFYEMFFEDAIRASELLQITLTARAKGSDKIPMCGVPYHSARRYIARLVEHGLKVAICEQVEAPGTGPGIVRRDWKGTPDPAAKQLAGDVIWDPVKQKGFIRFRGLAVNNPTREQYQLWIFDKTRDAKYPIDAGVFAAIKDGDSQ